MVYVYDLIVQTDTAAKDGDEDLVLGKSVNLLPPPPPSPTHTFVAVSFCVMLTILNVLILTLLCVQFI